MVGKRKGLRFAIAMLAAALFGGPALAAASEQETSGLQLAALVAQTTDVPAAQVAIAGSQNVYSVEPLGAPAATGEVIARVRTEAVDAKWSATHSFRSWEAHALFDCAGKRMRIIRSASYTEPNLKGEAKVDDLGGAWFAPKPEEPASVLLAAACDRNFAWPLRAAAARPAASPEAMVEKAKADAPQPAAAPAPEKATAPIRRTPPKQAPAPDKIEVATTVTASPPTGPPPAVEATQPAPRQSIKVRGSAVAAVRRWADAGEGFVSRRASSVRRLFAWRAPSRDVVQQAAL